MITKIELKNWRSHFDSKLEFSPGTNILLGPIGSGKSLPYSETILIKDSVWRKRLIGEVVEVALKKARNVIVKGDSIYTTENAENLFVQCFNPETFKLETRKVKAFIKHKSPKKLIQIKTRSGRRITITKDHSILIVTEKGILPEKGENIKPGVFIPSVRSLIFGTVEEKIDFQSILPDFRYKALMGLRFFDDSLPFSNATKPTIKLFEFTDIRGVRSDWKTLPVFFYKLFENDSDNKCFSNWVFNISDENLEKMISTYFEIYGRVTKDGKVVYSSQNLKFIDALMTLLCRWKIITTIREKKIKGKNYYELVVIPKHVPIFASHMNFLSNDKQNRLNEIVKITNNQRKWDGIDIIPNFFIRKLLHSLILEYRSNTKKDQGARELFKHFYSCMKNENIGREKLKRILSFILEKYKFKTKNFERLEKIVDSDVFFDKVIEIKEIPAESEWVYDISVEGLENFVAGTGNLIVHNSSILDAICFTLFGTFPNLQAKKIKLDDVIMNKPVEKTKAEVELHIQSNGKDYSVRRVIERGKGTTYSEIREDGKLLESPNAQRVTEKIEEILKVDYELFSKAIYSEQNALDYFLTIAKGQRMKKIDELLGIDKFEKARASSVTLKNRVADIKLGIESSLGQIDEEELKKNLLELKDIISKLLLEREQLEKNLEKMESERKRIEQELLELKKIRDGIEILRREERGKESALEETFAAIKSIEEATRGFSKEEVEREIREFEDFLNKKEVELKQKKNCYEKILSEISQANGKIKFLSEEKISRLKPVLEEKIEIKRELDRLLSITGENIEEQIDRSKNNLEKINYDISSTSTLISDMNSFIQHLSSSESKCPVCDSVLTQEKKVLLIKQKQDQLKKLQDKLANLLIDKQSASDSLIKLENAAKKIGEMYIQVKDLQDVQKEFEDSKKVWVELNDFVKKAKMELEVIKKEIDCIENEIKESEIKKRKYEILLIQLQDLEDRKKRIEELKKEIEKIKKKIIEEEAKLEGKDLNTMEKDLRSMISKESEVRARLGSYDSLIQEKKTREKEQEEKLKEFEKQKKEIQRLDRLVKDLEVFNLALEETQVELRNNFVEGVNSTMGKLWSTLYPYRDFISLRLNTEEGDYILQLQGRDGNWINVEGNVSGGERSIACLALRVALALALAPQLRILVLDEPTANLDAKAITELSITLRERINDFIDQTFLITHQPELEDAATGSIYRLERNKDENEPTKVIRID